MQFSYAFGHCGIDKEYRVNDQLTIEYVGDGQTVKAANHYVINIRPDDQKLSGLIPKREIIRMYELDDGTKAAYGTMFIPITEVWL